MAVLICADTAQAQDVADCTKYKKFTTQTEINFAVTDTTPVTEYSLAELGVKREKYFYQWRNPQEDSFWIADDEDMGGYFMAGLGAKIDFALKAMPYEGQPHLMCVYVEKIRVDFTYSGTVFLDRAYDAPECSVEKLMALGFMDQRFVMAHGVVDAKQMALHKDLPDIIARLERSPVQSADLENKIEQVKTILQNAGANYPEIMQAEIEEKSHDITEDSGIAARWVACRGLIRP